MKRLDDFRLKFGSSELVPLMIGGMGVDISTRELALEAARLGGIAHISDAMMPAVTDRHHKTRYEKDKLARHRENVGSRDKSSVHFRVEDIREATRQHVAATMEAKKGPGMVFINIMEKLTMASPTETLRARLHSALDGGIDGITLSAGLHLGSFGLMADHPRFRDAKLGVIVSSVRALQLFLRKTAGLDRLPDFVVVEGPLAGGHLGFGMDWADFRLEDIFAEVMVYLREQDLDIPVIPAGGIFTGSDATMFLEMGAAAVQVGTRFTVAQECGLPADVKQAYFRSSEEDVVVNQVSPTGYPMRMLRNSPAIGSGIKPNCEQLGYLLDRKGHCSYIDAYYEAVAATPIGEKLRVFDKTCLCTHMRSYAVWTCGQYVYRLKDTTTRNADGSYVVPTAEAVFRDYQFGTDMQVGTAGVGRTAAG